MNALTASDLHVTLNGSHILQGVNFEVPRKAVTALLGRNGAGKTTTLKALSGLLPHTGEVLLNDKNISALSAPDRLKNKMALCPEGRGIFPNLSVTENLMLGAYLEKSKSKIKAP